LELCEATLPRRLPPPLDDNDDDDVCDDSDATWRRPAAPRAPATAKAGAAGG